MNERKYFGKRSRIVILAYATVTIVGTCFFSGRKELLSLVLGLLPIALSLVAANLKSIWL